MRRGLESQPRLPQFLLVAAPVRLPGTPRGVLGLQTLGPRDLCFDFDLPFGGDKLVMLREVASPSMGLPLKLVCMGQRCGSAPTGRLLGARREGRSYGAAWTRPKTGCMDKNQ